MVWLLLIISIIIITVVTLRWFIYIYTFPVVTFFINKTTYHNRPLICHFIDDLAQKYLFIFYHEKKK